MPKRAPAELFEQQLEQSPFATAITTAADGVFVYVNEAARRLIREDGVDEPVGMDARELDFWSSDETRDQAIELARGAGGHIFRHDFADPAGEPSAELLSVRTATIDETEYLITTIVDISTVVQAEANLADALSRLERAQSMANIGDFVSELNRDFNGSAEAMRILGIGDEAKTITTKELFDTFHPEDKAMVAQSVNNLLPEGSFAIEHRLAPSGSDVRWVFTQANVETREDGTPFVRGTVQDITQRKRDEDERARLNQKMQEAQKLESLGVLSGGIAHDFNNLLAGIMGNADFALMEANIPPEIEVRLRDIVTASKRAADLTHQLLAYSGKGRFVIEPMSLSKLIREMADLLSVTINKDHALRFFLDEDIPAVNVDPTQIRQVMMNLIINASEAITHRNGMINITTGTQLCDADYLEASHLSSDLQPGTYAFFEISDNGVGMDAETIARLYDPFFTTKFTGRGLGMAAALGIARGHGGAIKVYSEVGRGTTFKLFLPTTDSPAKSLEPTSDERSGWAGSGGVLVIDDERTVRDFARGVLERYGYEVFLARDGAEGLSVFEANRDRISIVLLDLTMPNMDGKETYGRLKTLKSDISTVLMSGYNEQDATQHFVGKGLAGFLAKPFLVNDLMDAISNAQQSRDQ
ncbi:MAG: response regulator [Gammaproteobacteria bacterium]|nr:response regulator [Gammaproteobacteria bacterium]